MKFHCMNRLQTRFNSFFEKDSDTALLVVNGENGESYLVNGKPYDKDQTRSFLGGLSGYIITSYERPRQLFSELCGENTFAVMRIYMINDKEDGPQMIAAV